jgi:hypothetical protein
MEQERHHHLVLENSYVRAYFVEIPAHESTLHHRHDFPYLSVGPGGPDAAAGLTSGSAADRGAGGAHVGYTAAGFSHAVSNSGDQPLRNVAIELLLPQGAVRNRCEAVVPVRQPQYCSNHTPPGWPVIYPLFETDEVLVESWDFDPDITTPPWPERSDLLLAGLVGVSVAAESGIDSGNVLRGGLLWIPAGSKPVFNTGPDSGGHFIAITFKDSKPRGL